MDNFFVRIFIEGGWGSWAVLLFGMVTMGSAAQFARRPDRTRIGFLLGMTVTTIVSTVLSIWSNLGAVFSALESPERVPDAEFTRTLMAGLKEAGRPGTLAGIMLTVACVLVSIGLLREDRSKPSAS